MSQTSSLVLGAVLALGTSFILEAVRMWLLEARTRRLFKAMLKIEIPSICAAIETLVNDFNLVGFLSLLTIQQIQSARTGYERRREWTVLFRSGDFQRDLTDFYQRLATAQQEAMSLESFAATPQAQATYVAQRRASLIADFRDIATRGRSILQQIK